MSWLNTLTGCSRSRRSIKGVSVASMAPNTMTERSCQASCWKCALYWLSSTHAIMGQAMTGKPGTKCTTPCGPWQVKPGILL